MKNKFVMLANMKNKFVMLAWPFLIVFMSVLLIPLAAISMWTERTLEFWLSKYKGLPVDVPYWMAFVVTLLLNAIILTANIISELLRLVS